MIDLHLHSTASDGRLGPSALVGLAAAAGLTTISLTDHDTTTGLDAARAAAAAAGIRFVDGTEITAVEGGRDVHVLGYFFDPASRPLLDFLAQQRADRLRRVDAIAERLAALGLHVDVTAVLEQARRGGGRSVGRPQIADLLAAAGHARDRRDAFDRWLGEGRPAFVPRVGPNVARVVDVLHGAGGLASMAHPGLTRMDDAIARFATSGLDALEARYSEHDEATEAHYRGVAAALGLALSGGSDFHADPSQHIAALGLVSLPPDDFAGLEQRAAARRASPAERE